MQNTLKIQISCEAHLVDNYDTIGRNDMNMLITESKFFFPLYTENYESPFDNDNINDYELLF